MKLNPGHILASIKLSNMITGIGSLSKAITFLEKTFLIFINLLSQTDFFHCV